MIAVYHEPKGLAPDAEPIADFYIDGQSLYDAIRGSHRLLNAMLKAQGRPTVRWQTTIVRPKRRSPPKRVNIPCQRIGEIKAQVAAYCGLDEVALVGSRGNAEIAQARMIAMWLARELTKHSFPRIGSEFGNRDHTTVIHACREIPRRMAANAEFADQVNEIREELLTT